MKTTTATAKKPNPCEAVKGLLNEAETKRYIKASLIKDMEAVGIDPSLFMQAVDIATVTIFERERIYALYLEYEDNPEEGKPNPYDGRLRAWNSQARACLTMLRLTPPYIKADAMDNEDDDTDT